VNSKSIKKAPAILIAVVIVVVVAAGVWLVRKQSGAEGEPNASAPRTATVTAEQVDAIVGRWRRTDGGYVIEIRGIDTAGKLKVGYYNPNPINVSRSVVEQSTGGLHVFVELRDTGYPGATYRLDYDATRDTMTGLYYQPTAGQSFDVVFVREQ